MQVIIIVAKSQLKEVFMQIRKISNSNQCLSTTPNNYSDAKNLALPKEVSMGSNINAKLGLGKCGGWPLEAIMGLSSIKHI